MDTNRLIRFSCQLFLTSETVEIVSSRESQYWWRNRSGDAFQVSTTALLHQSPRNTFRRTPIKPSFRVPGPRKSMPPSINGSAAIEDVHALAAPLFSRAFALKEGRRIDLERLAHPLEHGHGRRILTALDHADIVSIHSYAMGQFFLGKPLLLADSPKIFCNDFAQGHSHGQKHAS